MAFESLLFHAGALNRQLFNASALRHNQFDCHIATAKNCGTHFIKYALSHILSEIYDLAPPQHVRDDRIVGHTKTPPEYSHIPQIAVTHSQPHYLMRYDCIHKWKELPKFIVLVRDIRAILVSVYDKWQGEKLTKLMRAQDEVSFSDYVRGDMMGKAHVADIWSLFKFFNAWGAVYEACPTRVKILKYEELTSHSFEIMRQTCDFIGIQDASDDIIQRALDKSSRSEMRKKLDKDEFNFDKSINTKQKDFMSWYNSDDQDFFNQACQKYLKHDFGYDMIFK